MKYYVTVGDREFEVTVDGDRVTIDGVQVEARLESVPGTPLKQVTVDGRSRAWPVERAFCSPE